MKAIAFGEVLIDVANGAELLGGASLNFSAHFAQLGGAAYLMTSLGRDPRGARIREAVQTHGIQDDFVSEVDYPTGWVDVKIVNGQPSYEIHENVAWDNITLSDAMMDHFRNERWDVFGFGTLAQRSEHNWVLLQKLLSHGRIDTVFFDLNIRNHHYDLSRIEWGMRRAQIIKMNEEEAPFLANALYERAMDIDELCQALRTTYDIDTILLTLGAEGCRVYHHDSIVVRPGRKVVVADTIGAGDSFSAAFLYFYEGGAKVEEACRLGIELSAYVASQSGGVPVYSDDIRAVLGIR